MNFPTRLRAHWVVPVVGDPIENGELIVEGSQVVEVRPAPIDGRETRDVRDFGDSILMPGLVNVHAHLDYTVMRGLLEEIAFFPWIRELTARKAAFQEEDWIASTTIGAAEAAASGVTTLGDCTTTGAPLVGASALGLRGIIFQEVFGIDESQTTDEIISDLDIHVRALRWRAANTHFKVGISPHAPYTVRPALFRSLANYLHENPQPVCIHAAESLAESELLLHGTGPIAEMFNRRGIRWETPGLSTVAYLHRFGMLSERTLLVHGVQASASDRAILRETGAAWAHCPKSNAKLGNGIAALGILKAAYPEGEARVGLGSDSVASNNTMDLFEEMRFGALLQRARSHRYDKVTAKEMVKMATIGGARALCMDREIGSLEPGKQADVTVVRLDAWNALPCYDPYSALVYAANARNVIFTMCAGAAIFDCGEFPSVDLTPALARFHGAAQKMRDWSIAQG